MALFWGESGTEDIPEHPAMRLATAVASRAAGAVAFACGLALAAALASYDANDPSFFSATPQEPSNWLGAPGALVADPLVQTIGIGAWGIALLLCAWGWRLAVARGDERFWSRLLAMPAAVATLIVFASLHTPWAGWQVSSGLGGVLGDRGVTVLLASLPMPTAQALLWLTLGTGGLTLLLGGLALGVTAGEARAVGRWLGLSLAQAAGAAASLPGARRGAGAGEAQPPRSERLAPAEPTGSWRRDADAGPPAAPARRRLRDAAPDVVDSTGDWEDGEDGEGEASARPAGASGIRAGAALAAGAGGLLGALAMRGAAALRPAPSGRPAAPETDEPRRMVEPQVFRAPGAPGTAREPVPATRPPARAAAGGRIAPAPPADVAGDAAPEVGGDAGRALAAAIRSLRNADAGLSGRSAPPLAEIEDDDWEVGPGGASGDDAGLDREPPVAARPPLRAAGEDRPAALRPELRSELRSEPRAAVSAQRAPSRVSRRAAAEAQPTLFEAGEAEVYEAPPLALLQRQTPGDRPQVSQMALEENARMLETVLEDYGVRGEIVAVKPGPVVTLYELEPAPGLKASRVIGLADDIARSMSALSARIATVPGRSVIGIELPNALRERVLLRETLESPAYGDARVPLALALGKDIEGQPVIANLAKMPHLLIAGTTGSGKSVAINTMILSLLYRLSPQQCRLIMIDPKMLELSVYDNIPHLLTPVVTDPKKAIVALKWVVAEMEERYRKMSKMGVRNIDGYNARCRDAIARGEEFSRTIQTGFDETTGEPVYETETFEPEEMPLIVVIVDEMADLMMVAGKEIEACIQRLAQMARASGIHLIMATQRPSVDVITGTIKANFPTRISFQVTSKIDSRTILGEQGAEQLLGQGDMLYMSGGGRIRRVHGPFVSDEEVEEVVRHLKSLGQPDYVRAVTDGGDDETQALVDEKLGLASAADGDDVLYDKAVAIVARDRKCSTSYIQRKLAIGYNKAARLVEMMEDQGVVTRANAVGKREILVEER